mgnify:CR=1 FL=1
MSRKIENIKNESAFNNLSVEDAKKKIIQRK